VSSPRTPLLDSELAEKVLVRFLRDELHRTGLRKLTLGLSGGIDSAVAAFLAVRAVGAEHLACIAMPSAESNPDSLADARLCAQAGGFGLDVVPVGDAAAGILPHLGDVTPTRRGNVLARLRMVVLYDRSAALPGLVVGTSNKTELLLGYGTLHGDMASALNPLGDLYKCQVRALARRLGVPSRIVEKAPSADLWAGQTDEGELGFSYDDADAILYRLTDLRDPPARLVADGFPEPLVTRIVRIVEKTRFKRRPPLIAKLSQRTLGWEHRYPRDAGT
jgi:NAD+ synthase